MKNSFLSVYNKDKAIPMLLELFRKDDITGLTENNIKIWNREHMSMLDVIIGCSYVKKELNSNIIIYTNIVPNKSYIEKNENVKIYDNVDLKELALKYNNIELYDML